MAPPRSLHLTVTALPWVTGGKEVYAAVLVRQLRALGQDARIVIHQDPQFDPEPGEYENDGVPVIVLPPIVGADCREAAYSCLPQAVPGFAELLARLSPDIVHFHDFSSGANRLHLHAERERGAGLVMAYHSPGQSCTQRSLLFRGQQVCDGRIDRQRCTACRLGSAGAPAWLANLVSRWPGRAIGARDTPLHRALSAGAATFLFIGAWQEATRSFDRILVHAAWVRRLLECNGVPGERIAFVDTRLADLPEASKRLARRAPAASPKDLPLQIAFVGRCDPVKGVGTLVEAVLSLGGDAPVEVSFYGAGWDLPYGRRLMARMAGDSRFRPPRLLPPDAIAHELARHDVVAVLSTWLETGPLVVLEAFALGLPVVGSDLGGIAELVRNGVDGMLIEPGDAAALAAALAALARDRSFLARLAADVRPPRTFAQVGRDVAALYDELAGRSARPAAPALAS
jgi:glycosyltransferase involved in cell wall biosynthesis